MRTLAFIAAMCIPSTAHTLHAEPETIRQALLTRVRIGKTYIIHCRRDPRGCPERVNEIATLLVKAADRYGLDVWLLAAIAIRESGLNPEARGAMGELGLMQLHPYSHHGMKAKMVCKRAPSDCTRTVIFEAAKHLRECVDTCGQIVYALGRYNSGICQDNAYARRVMREREALK